MWWARMRLEYSTCSIRDCVEGGSRWYVCVCLGVYTLSCVTSQRTENSPPPLHAGVVLGRGAGGGSRARAEQGGVAALPGICLKLTGPLCRMVLWGPAPRCTVHSTAAVPACATHPAMAQGA